MANSEERMVRRAGNDPFAIRYSLPTLCRNIAREHTMDKIKPLFTATATATGGRNGRTQTSDGIVNADLSVLKDMGGPGKPNTATPEHLFAAGYAACFGGALDFVGKPHKKDATEDAGT